MKVALATITIGDGSRSMWETVFAPSWREYVSHVGYTLEHFTEPIEPSDRHPSWQKLLLAGHERLAEYDRIVWLDHDILIAPGAPPIHEDVPDGKIGAVTWKGSMEDPLYFAAFQAQWRNNNAAWVVASRITSFADLLACAGYPRTDDWMNAGVFVFQPQHAELFREVYDHGLSGPTTSLEQAALTNMLCRTHKHLCHPLDRRFNVIWDFERLLYYPFVDSLYPESTIIMRCVDATLRRCHMLHFAGGGREYARAYVEQAHLRESA